MKKNLFITLMLVLLALPLASCGNDDEPKNDEQERIAPASFVCRIDSNRKGNGSYSALITEVSQDGTAPEIIKGSFIHFNYDAKNAFAVGKELEIRIVSHVPCVHLHPAYSFYYDCEIEVIKQLKNE